MLTTNIKHVGFDMCNQNTDSRKLSGISSCKPSLDLQWDAKVH